MNRPSWNSYFLDLAAKVSTRATCPRMAVGAVIVDPDKKIVSTGYNGSPSGTPHCTEAGCAIYKGHCIRTLHAEINSVLTAKQPLAGCVMYCTHNPCVECKKVISQVGIRKVVCSGEYKNNDKGLTLPDDQIFPHLDLEVLNWLNIK